MKPEERERRMQMAIDAMTLHNCGFAGVEGGSWLTLRTRSGRPEAVAILTREGVIKETEAIVKTEGRNDGR